MDELNCSYRELMETPAPLVKEVLVRRGARLEAETVKAAIENSKNK